jgi:hypothetical protein
MKQPALVYCNILIYLHHCLGGDLVHRYIGCWSGRLLGGLVGGGGKMLGCISSSLKVGR